MKPPASVAPQSQIEIGEQQTSRTETIGRHALSLRKSDIQRIEYGLEHIANDRL